ncbi:MAG: CPBP family intramembrane metalloprotease [Candidatus Lokiarchaeota archaeon]|nr:CPBP family intramembrane metalloprotease [Candidatus Harpocratesius repetitus]
MAVKKIITPIITVIAIIALFLVLPGDIPWFSYQSQNEIWLIKLISHPWGWLIGSFFVFLLFTEILTHYNQKYRFVDVTKSSFLTAVVERDFFGLLIQFPSIILFEEILFRGILLVELNLIFNGIGCILISSSIFSIYHLHIYFSSRQWGITFLYIILSFILGIVLATFFPFIGIIGTWIYHLIAVSAIYFRWYLIERKNMANKEEKEEE